MPSMAVCTPVSGVVVCGVIVCGVIVCGVVVCSVVVCGVVVCNFGVCGVVVYWLYSSSNNNTSISHMKGRYGMKLESVMKEVDEIQLFSLI